MDSTLEAKEPISRRGLASAVHVNGRLYLYGGYGNGYPQSLNKCNRHLDVFDFTRFEWTSIKTEGTYPSSTVGASFTVIRDCLYVFGGWYYGRRNADVHELNLVDYKWKKLSDHDEERAGPLKKDKTGMVNYGDDMLCIVGGYCHPDKWKEFVGQRGASYHWDHSSLMELCWTNELHLFHTKTCKVYIILLLYQ